jgi:hypothetical protein
MHGNVKKKLKFGFYLSFRRSLIFLFALVWFATHDFDQSFSFATFLYIQIITVQISLLAY